MAKRLAGQVALVTGGGRGLGRGIAEGFGAEGANVVVNYMKDSASAEAVVAKIKAAGADAIAVQADVGDEKAVQGMIESGMEKGMSEGYEKLDELVAELVAVS